MKIYGNNSFCVDAEEKEGFFSVSHRELKREISEKDVSYTFSFPLIDVEKPAVVCICTMTFNNKTVSGVGEIRDYRLLTSKEKENLIKAVARKAFDDAAINLMAFKEPVYPYLHGYNTNKQKKESKPTAPNISDIILVGSLKGKKYSEVKDSEIFKEYVRFLQNHPELEYDGKEANKQIDFFRTLEV